MRVGDSRLTGIGVNCSRPQSSDGRWSRATNRCSRICATNDQGGGSFDADSAKPERARNNSRRPAHSRTIPPSWGWCGPGDRCRIDLSQRALHLQPADINRARPLYLRVPRQRGLPHIRKLIKKSLAAIPAWDL